VEKRNQEISIYKARIADLTAQIQEEKTVDEPEIQDVLRKFSRATAGDADLRRRRIRKSPYKPLGSPTKFKPAPPPARWSRIGFALTMLTLGVILGTIYVGWSLRSATYGGDDWRYQPEDLWYDAALYDDQEPETTGDGIASTNIIKQWFYDHVWPSEVPVVQDHHQPDVAVDNRADSDILFDQKVFTGKPVSSSTQQ
jgi:hypothetical protein